MDGPPFPPESDTGSVEYKRHLHHDEAGRLTKLTTQLNYRLNQNYDVNKTYRATYLLGIDDNGEVSGQTSTQVSQSIDTLSTMVKSCGAEISQTEIHQISGGCYARVTVQRSETFESAHRYRIGFVGPSEAGKSTVMGVLTHGYLDNGEGSARSSILRHDHEFKQNGTTSSIKQEIIGFKNGKILNSTTCTPFGSWEYLVKNSDRLITLIDLPGSKKYLKTTIFGLTAHAIDFVFLVVTGNDLDSPEVEFLRQLCGDLQIPTGVLVTKIDLGQLDDNKLTNWKANGDFVFKVSSCTGEGFDNLHNFLNRFKIQRPVIEQDGSLFQINEVYKVEDVGTIAAGSMRFGEISEGDRLMIGPFKSAFHAVRIESIHCKQVPVKRLKQGEFGSCVISYEPSLSINKHLSLISKEMFSQFINKFSIVLPRSVDAKFTVGQSVTVNTNNVQDNVMITDMYASDDLDISDVNNYLILDVHFESDNIKYIEDKKPVVIRFNETVCVGRCCLDPQRDQTLLSDADHE